MTVTPIDATQSPYNVSTSGSASANATGLNSAFVAGASAGVPVALPGGAGASYPMGPITYDVAKTSLIGNGATLNFTAMTSGACITLTSTSANASIMTADHRSHPMENVILSFPDTAQNVTGVAFTPLTFNSLACMFSVHFVGVSFLGGRRAVEPVGGAVDYVFERCLFSQIGNSMGTAIYFTGGTNAGEKFGFTDCFFVNIGTAIDDGGNPNADFFLTNCSIDGLATIANNGGSKMYFTNCHVEPAMDADVLLNVTAGGSSGIWVRGGWWVLPARSTYAIGAVHAGSLGGINFSDVLVSGLTTSYALDEFITGSGRVTFENCSIDTNSNLLPFADGSNRVPDGHFSSGASVSSWNAIGNVSYYTGLSHSSPGCMRILGATGTDAAYIATPCKPGQYIAAQAYLLAAGMGSGGYSWRFLINFLDSKGNGLGGSGFSVSGTSNISSFTKYVVISQNTPAPAGTVSASIIFSLTNDASGNSVLLVDDVYFAVI
ncbi:MAG TPA: hypothetical protein VJ750_00705 [Rhizomicrobium sp.]|nr:hypothetical protein [Rhizomicrobium sp.]